MLEALYYEKLADKRVLCHLCPRKCKIREGGRGVCRVRYNLGGVLYTENDSLSAFSLDPIEKKPLYHFYPGKKILSVGASGCNFACSFCQNWLISQSQNENTIKMSPSQALEEAKDLVKLGNIGLAYTYSEPIVMFEYVLEAARLIKEANLKNIFFP
jgi:pyruvate formate lyase activating enzyme